MGVLRDLWRGLKGTAQEDAEEENIDRSPVRERLRNQVIAQHKAERRAQAQRLRDAKPSGPYTAEERVLLDENSDT